MGDSVLGLLSDEGGATANISFITEVPEKRRTQRVF
jgi:hypothetical protein